MKWLKLAPSIFVSPNGTKLNSLLYADDLIISSQSRIGLQNCLNTLHVLFQQLMDARSELKKTKIMIFQNYARKFTDNFYIGKDVIDLVHEYIYLGTRV